MPGSGEKIETGGPPLALVELVVEDVALFVNTESANVNGTSAKARTPGIRVSPEKKFQRAYACQTLCNSN